MQEHELILSALLSFLIAISAGLVFSAVFKYFRVPWAVALILGGIILGPHGLKIFQLNDIIFFLSEIGVIFLIFIAGMETRLSAIKSVLKESAFVALLTGLAPALLGLIVGIIFGYNLITTLLLAIILINSSFAVVIPALESRNILHTRIGKIIVSSTMFQDIASLVIFALFLQFVTPQTNNSIPAILIPIIFAFLAGIAIKLLMPKFRKIFAKLEENETLHNEIFEQELRIVLAILIGTVLIFEKLNFETIVGAFFAGLVLSEITQSKILERKIHILGYGVFIPIFFVVIGATTNLSLFAEAQRVFLLAVLVVIGSSLTKFVSGWIAAKMIGLNSYESALVGVTSMPQLITTLALALIGQRLGLLPDELVAVVVILAVSTVIISPTITNRLLNLKGLKVASDKVILDTGQTHTKT